MSYDAGRTGLDYLPCRYGNSKVLFRGPKRSLDDPYVAFLGGSETYGKFIASPFPQLVERELGTTCVNLGCVNAGLDVFVHDPYLPEIASKAKVTVIQVLGAQNMSNRLYAVHPRRNDRFVKPTAFLQMIYREVDFAEFNFNKHMLVRLRDISSERFETVKDELRSAWIARMRMLLRRIPGKTVLLWLGERQPADAEADLGTEPWLVGEPEIAALQSEVTTTVRVVASPDALARGTDEMVFAELDRPAAERMMNPAVHREVAGRLTRILSELI